MKAKETTLSIIRILIGLFFIATAVLKILSIKEFELYIYSYGILNYTLCTLAARCLIAFEMCAGLCLIMKWYYKLAWWLVQISLVAFTIFLIFAQLRGDTNCHCLGDFVELNPLQSMIKNIALMLVLLFVRNQESWNFKYGAAIKPAVMFVVALIPFIVAPPELLYGKIYTTDRNINTISFEKSLNDSSFMYCYPVIYPDYEFDSTTFVYDAKDFKIEGKNVIMLAHAGCKYCKQGAKRLALFFKENKLDRNKCKVLIFGGPENVYDFIAETEGYGFEYREINPVTSIEICDGQFPTFMLMQNDSIIKSFDLWGLEETTILDFLGDSGNETETEDEQQF